MHTDPYRVDYVVALRLRQLQAVHENLLVCGHPGLYAPEHYVLPHSSLPVTRADCDVIRVSHNSTGRKRQLHNIFWISRHSRIYTWYFNHHGKPSLDCPTFGVTDA